MRGGTSNGQFFPLYPDFDFGLYLDETEPIWYIWRTTNDGFGTLSMTKQHTDFELSPTVQYIAQVLEERVHTGVYPAGFRLPSERTLADEFGVSRVIIRQVIEEVERRGLLHRLARCRPIIRDIKENGGSITEETPDKESVSSVRRGIAVWLWPGLNSPSAAMIIRGIRQALPPRSFRLLLESPLDTREAFYVRSEAEFLHRVAEDHDVAGVLLWYLGGEENIPALQHIRQSGIPMVFLDREPPHGFEADYVGVDNLRAAEIATRHLISLGHRRILHVTNSERVSTVMERLRGYERAMERAGLSIRPEWIIRDEGGKPDDPEYGQRLVHQAVLSLLRSDEPPTAVFCVNDFEAFFLLDALKQAGVHVPEQISVMGFDGMERWRPGRPTLSTVWQPFDRVGECAVERLLYRLENGTQTPVRHQILDVELIEAETCRPLSPLRPEKENRP